MLGGKRSQKSPARDFFDKLGTPPGHSARGRPVSAPEVGGNDRREKGQGGYVLLLCGDCIPIGSGCQQEIPVSLPVTIYLLGIAYSFYLLWSFRTRCGTLAMEFVVQWRFRNVRRHH